MIPVIAPELQASSDYPQADINGKIVFAPCASKITYLMNTTETVEHTWTSEYFPTYSCYYLPDSSILRIYGAGVQRIAWDGTILWDYHFTQAHHDAIPMPNGNVLILASETKTNEEAIAMGRDPTTLTIPLNPDYIIEVTPTGPTSGDIVWEWHVWDHLIQDFDPAKQNYGNISQHPELLNINYIGDPFGLGWLHCNSLDYNLELNQILISSRDNSEIWIIDHTTAPTEAAGHTQGRYNHGGDFLYRWGNPAAYDRGTESDRTLFYQHYAKWIPPGRPGAGHITVFNNCPSDVSYSSADEFIPPLNQYGSYDLAPDTHYGPIAPVWQYQVTPRCWHMGSVERLPNGNTLICQGERGTIFVITPDGQRIWSYQYPGVPPATEIYNPVFIPNTPPLTEPNLDADGYLEWNNVEPGSTITGSFQIHNLGNGTLNWTINTSSISWGTWTFSPSTGSTPHSTTVLVSVLVPDETNSNFDGYILAQNNDNTSDTDIIPVLLTTPLMDETTPTAHHLFLFHLLRTNHVFSSQRIHGSLRS